MFTVVAPTASLSLDEHFIKRPAATFFVAVEATAWPSRGSLPAISRWSRPERPKPGEAASASGSVNWSTAQSGIPCPSGGSPWVSDRIQTGVCRRRRVTGLPPHDAIEPGNIRTTSAPLSPTPLMTADHHGRPTGLRYCHEIARRLRTPPGPRFVILRTPGCGLTSGLPTSTSIMASNSSTSRSSTGKR